MPHICTRCNNIFESGEDILKGCPSCGWKKFMFVRKMPRELDMSKHSEEQIITRAMGVKVPPRRSEKNLWQPIRPCHMLYHAPSHFNSTLTPTTHKSRLPENELSPGGGKASGEHQDNRARDL